MQNDVIYIITYGWRLNTFAAKSPNWKRGLTYHFTYARTDIVASSPTPLVSLPVSVAGNDRW